MMGFSLLCFRKDPILGFVSIHVKVPFELWSLRYGHFFFFPMEIVIEIC